MIVVGRYRAVQRPQFVVGAVDVLARALGTQGPLAPPSGELECVIVRQAAPLPARTFQPPLRLVGRLTPNGFLVLDGRYRIGGGPVRDTLLAAGTYDAELRGNHYRPAAFALGWPPRDIRSPTAGVNGPPVEIELLPGTGYPFPDLTASPFNLGPTLVRGTVFTTAGAPVADATVSLPNLPPLNPAAPPWPFIQTRSGPTGDWALLLPDRRRLGLTSETTAPAPFTTTIRIAHPPHQAPIGPIVNVNVTLTLGRENALPNTALRGRVTGAGGRPLPGARITTSVNALESRSRADGTWSLYFDPNQPDVAAASVTATGPAGNSTTLPGIAVRHRGTVVVPTLHIG